MVATVCSLRDARPCKHAEPELVHSISREAKDAEFARAPEQNEALAELLTLARDRRAESDARLSLGGEVMVCLRKAGVFRAMVSREFGGDELPPSDFSSAGGNDLHGGWINRLDRQPCCHVAYCLSAPARNSDGHFPAFSGHLLCGKSFSRAGHSG